jgi:hypothetical protein
MKTLVGIFTHDAAKQRQADCYRWFYDLRRQGLDCLFVLGNGGAPERLDGDRLYLPCSPAGYPDLPARSRLFAKYALEHGYDYCFKCDDDTTICPRRFAEFQPAADYTGVRGKPGEEWGHGGFGYWLSRRAMAILAAELPDEGAEDMRSAECLARHGIPFTPGDFGTIHHGTYSRVFDLPAIRTIVYTADKPHCRARWPRIDNIMKSLGVRSWSLFVGKAGNPYWQAIRPEYASLLRQHEPPLIILEDDIGLREFRPQIEVPADGEVIYLGGGGSWRNSGLVREGRRHHPELTIYRSGEIGFADLCPYNQEWVRVFGMFGTHAILYPDKRVMLEMADAIERHNEPVDVAFGRNQWRWNCLLRRVPMFYQNDGHNDAGTYSYPLVKDWVSKPVDRRAERLQRQLLVAGGKRCGRCP